MHSPLFPRVALVSIASFAFLLGSGCSTVDLDPKGESQATFVAGEFRALVNAPATNTARATSEAFRQLGLFEIRNEIRTFEADLAARTPRDERVRVSIKEINSRQTQVGIRVDMVGDRQYSRKLFEQIDKNLAGSGGTTPAAW